MTTKIEKPQRKSITPQECIENHYRVMPERVDKQVEELNWFLTSRYNGFPIFVPLDKVGLEECIRDVVLYRCREGGWVVSRLMLDATATSWGYVFGAK